MEQKMETTNPAPIFWKKHTCHHCGEGNDKLFYRDEAFLCALCMCKVTTIVKYGPFVSTLTEDEFFHIQEAVKDALNLADKQPPMYCMETLFNWESDVVRMANHLLREKSVQLDGFINGKIYAVWRGKVISSEITGELYKN